MNWPDLSSKEAITAVTATILMLSLAAGFAAPAAGNHPGIDHGNWSMFSANAQNTAHIDTTGPSDNASVVFNVSLDSRIRTAPITVDVPQYENRTIFVGDLANKLYAVDARTGDIRWKTRVVSGFFGIKTPAVVDVGRQHKTAMVRAGGQLFAYDAANGTELCTFGPASTAPTVVRDVQVAKQSGIPSLPEERDVVFVGASDRIIAYDAQTCNKLWERPGISSSEPLAYAGHDVTNHSGGTVYVTASGVKVSSLTFLDLIPTVTSEGTLVALNATTGEPRWVYAKNGRIGVDMEGSDATCFILPDNCNKKIGDQIKITSAPAVADNTVYVGTKNGSTLAVDASTGDHEWKTDLDAPPIHMSPSVFNDSVYITGRKSNLGDDAPKFHALDASTGSKIWSKNVGHAWAESYPVIEQGVYVTNGTGVIMRLDTELGTIDTLHDGGDLANPEAPVVLDGVLYYGNNEHLIALEENQSSTSTLDLTG